MRYAIYYTPPAGSALARLGQDWFGGAAGDILGAASAGLTETPRRYGFHATLKAPFALSDGASAAALSGEMADFAASRAPVTVGYLRVARLDGFIALRLAAPAPALSH